jgi:thermopsin
MGIADFGVTGVRSGAYEYAADSFEGTAEVNSMRLAVNGGGSVVAFELNAMLVLRWGGTNYTYWIQNGLHVDTSSRQFTIGGAYVWNFSATGAHLVPSELRGANGSVLVSDTYYYIPTCNGLPGQCTTLSWPTTLSGRINASSTLGVPVVEYAYDLGNGWVSYDTVSFLHMTGATVTGFVVDGYTPTPYANGLFYDAEWDWVAAGGGSTGQDQGSDVAMSLEFWNGHNYEAVPNAWDFGGDTGESSSNVSDTLAPTGAGGAPAAHLSSGSGTLGVLYNASERGFVDVSVPTVPQGTLEVDGTPLSFTGSAANLTLDPGAHAISLVGYSNATEGVEVIAGDTTYVNLSGAGQTSFIESGLPAGTQWGVAVNGVNESTRNATLSFSLPNGTYEINYSAVPGYIRPAGNPNEVTVPVAEPVAVVWAPFTFEVPFSEQGLPGGTLWWVDAGGLAVRGSSMTLDAALPNGSTAYSVGSAFTFEASPARGILNVTAGAFAPVVVEFTYRPGFIVGTVTPSNATVVVGNVPVTVTGGVFNESILPGMYTLVARAPGYVPQTLDVNTTAGNATTERIVLAATPSNGGGGGSSGGSTGPPTLLWAALGGVVAVAVIGAGAFLLIRRRTPPRG